uniref:Uncharacterized protein n=1 Tax=Manihot esculenta TaxID=3983 RepID=A0A2C9W4V0_MANES
MAHKNKVRACATLVMPRKFVCMTANANISSLQQLFPGHKHTSFELMFVVTETSVPAEFDYVLAKSD